MTENDSPDDDNSSRLLLDTRARALLRRTDPLEVRQAYVWANQVAKHPKFKGKQINLSRLIALAPVVALVREETGHSLGQSLRLAKISERHVRRLLAADRADIDDQLAKIVRLLGKKASIADLVATSIFWGERTIRTIAMDYFGIDDAVTETAPSP